MLPDLRREEVLTLRERLHPHLSETEVLDRFDQFGGCARWIFKMLPEQVEAEIQKFARKMSLSRLKRTLMLGSGDLVSSLAVP